MKKILSLILAMLMVVSVLPAVFAADVTATAAEEVSPYQAAIDFLGMEQINIYHGTATGAAANEDVTRWQMALFVARLITAETEDSYWATTQNDSGFTDVAEFNGKSDAVLGAISFASQKGIVNGIGGGLFDPEGGIEYRQAITMIVRALGYTYKASGYPWSYITKARELGLLEGISGVGLEETITRGVVAQLLYNAFFADVDGKTVAGSVFNVGMTVVLLTASNNVVYEGNAAKVLRDNYVQFSELDEQGEPTGAKYHVSMLNFGLSTKAEADAAVGTPYFVYYKDGCADIISAEPLSKIFWNLGSEKQEIKTSTAGSNKYVTIDGQKLQVVTSYNGLNRKQGWNKDSAGTDQVKVYKAYGATTYSYNTKYIVASNGDIYDITNPATPYAYYSAVMDAYYRQDGAQWKVFTDAEIQALLSSATTQTPGFSQGANISAYTKVVASDASMDGYYDRITVKEFSFGKITYNKHKDKQNKEYPDFTIAYAATADNQLDDKAVKAEFQKDYRWTGMAQKDIPNGSYVLYYVDTINKEIDVLKVLSTTKGYIRGFDVTTNTIIVGEDQKAYTIGYNALSASPIKDKDFGGSNKNLANNLNVVRPFMNQYATFVVVDNKVVYIENASSSTDYVIIDSFVSFEDDGIVANAWNTVNDTYEQIKIASFNGWTIGGLDYYLYYLSGLFQNAQLNPAYQQIIPVSTYTLYQVVYQNNGVYNLTNALGGKPVNNISVNKYGYIVGTDGKGNFADANYTSTTATDYWMILDTRVRDNNQLQPRVYTFNGKLNPITIQNLTGFKCKDTDYVFVTTANTEGLDNLDSLIGNDIKFMMYNALVNKYGNDYYLTQVNPFQYGLFMTNVLTGAVEYVNIDPKIIGTNNFTGIGYVEKLLKESSVYKVSAGVLSSNTPVTFDTVASFYGKSADYVKAVLGQNVPKNYAAIRTAVATDAVATLFEGTMDMTKLIADLAKKVTVYGIKGGYLTSKEADINAILAGSTLFTMDYIIKKDGSAVVWLTETAVPTTVTGTFAKVKAGYGLTGDAFDDATNTFVSGDFKVSYEYNAIASTAVITVEAINANQITFNGATDTIAANLYKAGMSTAWLSSSSIVTTGDANALTKIVVSYTGVTEVPAGFNMQVNRPASAYGNFRLEASN